MAKDSADPTDADAVETDKGNEDWDRVRDVFCVRPWLMLGVLPSGLTRFCCETPRLIRNNGKVVSIHNDELEEIWNGQGMRDVRKRMLAGEAVEECRVCYDSEAATGSSVRLNINREFDKGTLNRTGKTAAAFASALSRENTGLADSPVDVDLQLGNTCNLKCRMCSGNYSSLIEKDPVQSKWRPPLYTTYREGAPEWKLLPNHSDQAGYFNVVHLETDKAGPYREVMPGARIDFENKRRFSALSLECDGVDDRGSWMLDIIAGNRTVLRKKIRNGGMLISVPEEYPGDALSIRFRFEKGLFKPKIESAIVLRVRDLTLKFADHGEGQTQSRRHERFWARPSVFSPQKLIDFAPNISRLQLMGGEPLLIKESLKILEDLAASDKAKNLPLVIVTNGTIWNEKIEQTLAPFPQVYFNISIDGTGPAAGYVRGESDWDEVSPNLQKMAKLSNSVIRLGPTWQVYNFFEILNIFKFARSNGYLLRWTRLFQPAYLAVDILPPAIKRAFYDECSAYSQSLERRIDNYHDRNFFEQLDRLVITAKNLCDKPQKQAMIEKFMTYTNDLDRSRGQNFQTALPVLADHFDRAGLKWSDKGWHYSPEEIQVEKAS